MTENITERKLAENQVYFRTQNDKLQKLIDETKAVAAGEDALPPDFDENLPLYFLCECSNDSCTNRILLSLKEYSEHHERNDTFTISSGHSIESIEDVTFESQEFTVVTKKEQPPKEASTLHEISPES